MTIGGVSRRELPRRKSAPAETNTQSDHDSVLKDVMKMFQDSWDYTKTLHDTWKRDLNLLNNIRVLKSFVGVSDTFIPMAFSTVETMNSAIVLGDLTVEYTPQDIYKYLKDEALKGQVFEDPTEEHEYLLQYIREKLSIGYINSDDLKALNALFSYWWEDGDWVLRLEELVDEGLSIGQAAWWLSWEGDRPCLESVSFRDYIFDPTATNDETCGYQGRRYITTYDKIKDAKVIDPETRELVHRYKNYEDLKNTKQSSGENTNKQELEQMFMGSTLNLENDSQIEIIEIWTPDKTYTIGNRKVVLENVENPHKTQAKLMGFEDMPGMLPGITWANYKKKSLLVGKSEVSTFWQEQERLNDLANQKSDSITRSLLQQKRIDPKYAYMAKMLDIPGAVLPIPQGTIEEISKSNVPFEAFREEDSIKNNIREATAIDQIVKGVGADSQTTATEVRAQVASAGQRIDKKIKSLERGPLKSLARKVFHMVRLYVSDPVIIPTTTNKGIKPVLYEPKKYNQDYVPHVQLSINARAHRREEQSEGREMYSMLIQDPTNNLQAVKKILLPKILDLDKDEIAEITAAPQQPQGMPPNGPLTPGAPTPLPDENAQIPMGVA